MGLTRRIGTALSLTAMLAAAGPCAAPTEPPAPVELTWQEITLPPPPAGERIVLRAAAVCGGRWYLVGAYGGAGDTTRPAAWTSRDGRAWTAMTVAADSYYGLRSVIFTAACRDGRLAAIGGRPGGAHGNPRVSSYHLVTGPNGAEVLTEVAARFELYGGPTAVNVGRLDAGPAGWIITGNRASGAAVWLSPDASRFEIVEAAPVLSSTTSRVTWASDAAAHRGEWTVVGGAIAAGRIDRDPAVWVSADGLAWRSVPVPAEPDYDELTLLTEQGDTLVGVGLSGATFRAWRLTGSGWQAAGRFGTTQPPPGGDTTQAGVAIPADLAAAGSHLVAAVTDGSAYYLWLSSDQGVSWSSVVAPVPMPAGAGRGAAVAGIPATAGGADRVLLAVDDGATGRILLADLPR